MVVRMVEPGAGLPLVLLPDREHRVAVPCISGNSRERHETGIARALSPVGQGMPAWICELPVGHALHRGEDGCRSDSGRRGLAMKPGGCSEERRGDCDTGATFATGHGLTFFDRATRVKPPGLKKPPAAPGDTS